MRNKILIIFLLFNLIIVYSQEKKNVLNELSIEKIMRDPIWIGAEPKRLFWSYDSKTLYFSWNKNASKIDSVYKVAFNGKNAEIIKKDELKDFFERNGSLNSKRNKMVYSRAGDIYILDLKTDKSEQITFTSENEINPFFSLDDKRIIYMTNESFYSLNLSKGEIKQLVKFVDNNPSSNPTRETTQTNKNANQDKWLQTEELKLFQVLKDKRTRNIRSFSQREQNQNKTIEINKAGNRVSGIVLSPDEKFVAYSIFKSGIQSQNTIVPNYVNETGYTINIPSRSKVGSEPSESDLFICNLSNGEIKKIDKSKIEGIFDLPEYLKTDNKNKYDKPRAVSFRTPIWSTDGKYVVCEAVSFDQKDRWLFLLNPESGELELLDRQRDEAWVGGPGVFGLRWMPDNKNIWFQSEESGYSHLYLINVETKEKRALTKGNFEIYNPKISKDNKHWYFSSNEKHPGIVHFYKMPINGGQRIQITKMDGKNEVVLSPDEKTLAIRFSYTNKPWELYIMKNDINQDYVKITDSYTDEFKSYPWRDSEVISYKSEDGKDVYARIYHPEENKKNGAAVIFVHGAGYLQNAHKWWSTYSREYMFHNLLADLGYTVLDIDYRGSSGYGSKWRTDIYRYMGDKDLLDHIDGVKYLIKNHNIDPKRVGIYGGSYGGFITLMAMFTKQDYFAAGAALRSVTDWAHYNHQYSAQRLNTPITDSLAYARSSPIYFAEGLKGALLICHGMVDTNVHFQDVVRLAQRLIELGKENWEMAIYPVEDHAFIETSSWVDEYKRILKLFENNLKK